MTVWYFLAGLSLGFGLCMAVWVCILSHTSFRICHTCREKGRKLEKPIDWAH